MQKLLAVDNRKGFSELKKRDIDLYEKWVNHIRNCTDQWDWGYLHSDGVQKPRANRAPHKECINTWLNWTQYRQGPRPHAARELSLRRLETSCASESTIYYTSNPTTHFATLLLDIDDKEGIYGDARDIFGLLTAIFPDIHGEVSTFGKGYHGYLHVHYPEMFVADFRKLCADLQASLEVCRADHGFISIDGKARIEVKGVPPLLSDPLTYKTCGSLAKFPRLWSDDHIRDYLSRPVFTPAALLDVVNTWPVLTIRLTEREGEEVVAPPVESTDNASADRAGESVLTIRLTEGRGREVVQSSPCPASRMGNVSRAFARRLGRVHTSAELIAEYESQGMATGDDNDGNRAELAEGQTEWQRLHFTPTKSKARGYDAKKNVKLVADYLTQTIRNDIRQTNRSSYSDEQAAVALYTIELAATTVNPKPALQNTIGNNAITAMMAAVGVEIEGTPEAQRRKLSAIKQALVASKLAVWVDETYDWGRCKRLALGPAHPRVGNNLPFVVNKAKPTSKARPKCSKRPVMEMTAFRMVDELGEVAR